MFIWQTFTTLTIFSAAIW